MTATQFFSRMLLLPLVVGVGSFPMFPESLPALTITIAGLPYLIIATVAYFLIRKAISLRRLAATTLLFPLGLALLLTPFLGLLVAYVLIVGYGYVCLAWILYFAARSFGLVSDTRPGKEGLV